MTLYFVCRKQNVHKFAKLVYVHFCKCTDFKAWKTAALFCGLLKNWTTGWVACVKGRSKGKDARKSLHEVYKSWPKENKKLSKKHRIVTRHWDELKNESRYLWNIAESRNICHFICIRSRDLDEYKGMNICPFVFVPLCRLVVGMETGLTNGQIKANKWTNLWRTKF